MAAQKRSFNEGKRHFKKNKKAKTTANISDGSAEEVLLSDIRALLKQVRIKDKSASPDGDEAAAAPPPVHSEVEVTIATLSSTGDGLGERDGHVYVVPFTAPGDVVKAKTYRQDKAASYSLADFVSVTTPSPHRTETPPCPYFSVCSGCQFQHMSYPYQLAHKRSIVEKAYRNFSLLPPEAVPAVGDTIGSPLQYGYRTKLTPHFDGPAGGRSAKRRGEKVEWPEVPPIGFMKKGSRKTMDIEDCPIGTDAVRAGMKRERLRVAENIQTYQKGATLLLRESTERVALSSSSEPAKAESTTDTTNPEPSTFEDRKTCITDHKATSTEYIDDFRFDNPAGSFFQNNNSILPLVTQYIRDHILAPDQNPPIRNMIDAYCGSGFFTVTLSKMFSNSIGIDISPQSIAYASTNAALNKLPPNSTRFLAADANALFDAVDAKQFPPAETVVVIDPPRKGCDEGFIRQLLAFAPARICYVSCNVHTQARDVGWLVRGFVPSDEDGEHGNIADRTSYEIESLRGFDFFPQTSHVEGVAILRKREASVLPLAETPAQE